MKARTASQRKTVKTPDRPKFPILVYADGKGGFSTRRPVRRKGVD